MAKQVELSIREKIGQLFMIGIGGESLTKEEEELIVKNNVGFVILFSRNISSPGQIRRLTDSIHSLGSIRPYIFIDQEGGLVIRLGEMGSTVISHMGLSATGKESSGRKAASIIGREMKNLGIDGIFAPVLDVNSKKDNPVIGIRAFSDNPEMVADFGIKFAEGLRREKIIPCGKHYPGHGHVSKDSHFEIPRSEIDIHHLFRTNLYPFKRLIEKNIEALMSAHVLYPEHSNEIGTFSEYFTKDLLRDELGFEGVLFSDCLEMDAIKKNFTPEEVVDKTFSGGIDVLSVSHSLELQKKMMEIVFGKIKNNMIPEKRIETSLFRILNLKEKYIQGGKLRSKKNGIKLRTDLGSEKKLAASSITVLRNDQGLIPVHRENKCLLIDLKKRKHSTDFSAGTAGNKLKDIAVKYLKNFEVLKMGTGTGTTFSKENLQTLRNFDNVIIFDFSFFSGLKEKTNLIKKILSIRKDAMLIALESPYIISDFPEVKTSVLSYGSRDIQIEALFKILTGEKKSKGRLPVNISDQFPRGSGL